MRTRILLLLCFIGVVYAHPHGLDCAATIEGQPDADPSNVDFTAECTYGFVSWRRPEGIVRMKFPSVQGQLCLTVGLGSDIVSISKEVEGTLEAIDFGTEPPRKCVGPTNGEVVVVMEGTPRHQFSLATISYEQVGGVQTFSQRIGGSVTRALNAILMPIGRVFSTVNFDFSKIRTLSIQ